MSNAVVAFKPQGSSRLCTVRAGGQRFGLATEAIREVIRAEEMRRVPRSPAHVAGLLVYRGDVLLAISLHALLNMEGEAGATCALVMEDSASGEPFALLVDALEDVLTVDRTTWEPNPATLDARRQALYAGLYKTEYGVIAQLHPEGLRPSNLSAMSAVAQESGELTCA